MASLALLLTAVPAPDVPVSYSRQIAPILAFHCNHCHGGPGTTAAGGLSTYTYAGLRAGGNFGPAVVPGEPDASPLVAFIEGRRGEARRMPLNAPPLEPAQVDLIRRWITEGAAEDVDTTPKYTLRAPSLPRGAFRIAARVPSRAYLTLAILDYAGVRTLFERADPATPGNPVSWTVQPGENWPKRLSLRLTISYAELEPLGAVVAVNESGGLRAGAEGLELDLTSASEVTVECAAEGAPRPFDRRRLRLPAGLTRLPWNLPLPPGLYTARVRRDGRVLAVLFRVP